MGKIFYIAGKSSSGKDTIYRRLLDCTDLRLETLVPYTTRPIRDGEENGREYFFTDEAELERLRAEGKIIEERMYSTFYGPWYYFTVDDGQLDLEKQDYLLIGTLESYRACLLYTSRDFELPKAVTYSDDALAERLSETVFFKKANIHPPEDAYISGYIEGRGYEIVPEDVYKRQVLSTRGPGWTDRWCIC